MRVLQEAENDELAKEIPNLAEVFWLSALKLSVYIRVFVCSVPARARRMKLKSTGVLASIAE
jgi:hypothetical protein